MLGIDVEQCSCQAWQGGLKVGDGGIVGSLVLGFRGKKGFV